MRKFVPYSYKVTHDVVNMLTAYLCHAFVHNVSP